MKRPRSLQWQLSISLVSGVVLMWAAGTGISGYNLNKELSEVFDRSLEETAQRVLPLAVSDILERSEEGQVQRVARVSTQSELLTYVVRDNKGQVLLRSHDAKDAVFPPFEYTGFSYTKTHRLYYDSALNGSITIAVAEPLKHRTEAMRESIIGLLMPLLVLIPFGVLGVLWRVRHSLRPVTAFQSVLETRGSGDLTAIPDTGLPSEVLPVSKAVNDLLDRLRRAMEAERSFTANSAHELRTPVAAALAQTQRVIALSKDAETAENARKVETALKRLAALTEKLMQLAKSEGAGLVSEKAGNIGQVFQMVVSDFPPEQRQRLNINMPDQDILSAIDLNAFAILCRNLIENALKHGDPEKPVDITLDVDATLSVVNDGTNVPQEILRDLTKPFRRGESQAEGSGLGLAIVDAIATGAGCQLTLNSPPENRKSGFEAIVRLTPKANG